MEKARRPSGFFRRMKDKELLEYCFEIHGNDITRSELSKRDGGLYNVFRSKELLAGIKIKLSRYANIDNRRLLAYCFSLHGSRITRGELRKKDVGLYNKIRRMGLLGKIPTAGKPRRRFMKITDQELLDYCFNQYGQSITRGELNNTNPGLYRELSRKKLLNQIKMIRKPRGYFAKWINFKAEINKAIEANSGEFPTEKYLRKNNCGYLIHYAHRYHGGMAAVREKIGYNEQMRIKLAEELEEIVDRMVA